MQARNLLLSKRESLLEQSEEQSEGFKRVGKALVSGMHQALFARRGSDRNQNLIKSLMAAISKAMRGDVGACKALREALKRS